ncbi:hypothetical protein M885DRAFT_37780 [Pelagophyceae sp. CCMP2097]|nr:hypothetical protein M885DRAFT_37780 [Pelagophyceae sp. CCMP2097]
MAMVLKAHAPGFDADPAVYGAFVDAIASVSRKFTRDVRQLRRLTTSPELFAVYSAEPTPAERFAAIMPALRATAPKLHDMNLDVPKAIADAALPSGGSARLERLRACRTLSGQAALVLLAAFIASHTTKERDEVLFTNKASKRRQAAAPQSQKIVRASPFWPTAFTKNP